MILADTDVLIDFLHGAAPGANAVRHAIERGDLATSAISRFELLSGARSAKSEQAIRDLLRAIPALPLDALAGDRAALLGRALEDAGTAIGMADLLIAGIALVHEAPLLTRNRRHFARIPGLVLAKI